MSNLFDAVKAIPIAEVLRTYYPATKLKSAGDDFVAECPLHEENTASFHVYSGKNRWHCFGACGGGGSSIDLLLKGGVEPKPIAAAKSLAAKFGIETHNPKQKRKALTVAQYAGFCALPADFLVQTFLLADSDNGVEIPYKNEGGEIVSVQLRHALEKGAKKDRRFSWRKGDKILPYGLWLPVLRDSTRLIVVEGASDVHVLSYCELAALGIPGAGNFKPEMVSRLLLFAEIVLIQEPGPGGEAFINSILAALKADKYSGAVRVILLPSKDPRDLWLSCKHREQFTAKLEDVITQTLPTDLYLYSKHEPVKQSTGPYRIEGGRIVRERMTKDGPVVEALCNFNAWVHEEIILDDGAEATRAFQIQGKLENDSPLSSVRIPATRFAGMTWVTESWGMRAIVRAGLSTKDSLREAIQRLSPQPRLRRIFTHTGWRQIDGEWHYLSGSEAADGFEVDLGSELARYRLPIEVEDPVEAMRCSLKLMALAPLRITAPLWSACYRAPLVSAFPQDLSLWVEGKTGSMKSTLVAVFLSHFGDFGRLDLPDSWLSTANELEQRAFLLKDTLFVIDEYAPSALDHREFETKAARILRAQGNHSARGRLKSDLSLRPAFPPRGIIISTGEQHPPGQSLSARTLIIELDRGAIDINGLTEAQQLTHRLSHAMAGYVGWLKPQMTDMPALLRQTFAGARTKATNGNQHLRIPEAAAHLWLGLHCGLSYAEEIGAVTRAEASELRKNCWEAFIEIGCEQAKVVEEEQPTRRFLSVLSTIITQSRAVLSPRDENPGEIKPGVDFIGWKDTEFLYLVADAAFSAVVRFCRDTGEFFPIRLDRLKRDLAKEKISECEPDRLTATAWVGSPGHTKRVLKLDINKIETILEITGLTGPHRSHHIFSGERDGL